MITTATNYLEILKQSGLKGDQAIIYEVLLKHGPKKASSLGNFVPFKRALVYKILAELVDMGLVVKKEESGKVAVFEPAHPLKIKDWVARQQEQYKNAELVLDGFMPKLISDYNLVSGMPGVQIFEGVEGMKKALVDSLTSKTEILSYIDNQAALRDYKKINDEYVAKRNKVGVKKKLILVDSPFVREHAKGMNRKTTEARVIPSAESFTTVMQIYDAKVSYITWEGKNIISVILDNPNIAKMHRILFNAMWNTAVPLP